MGVQVLLAKAVGAVEGNRIAFEVQRQLHRSGVAFLDRQGVAPDRVQPEGLSPVSVQP